MKFVVIKEVKELAADPSAKPSFSEGHMPVWGSDSEGKCDQYARNQCEREPGVTYAVYARTHGYTGVEKVIVENAP